MQTINFRDDLKLTLLAKVLRTFASLDFLRDQQLQRAIQIKFATFFETLNSPIKMDNTLTSNKQRKTMPRSIYTIYYRF